MISRILVGLAGTSYAQVATQTAIDIARSHDAELTGVTAVDLEALQNVGPVPLGAGQSAKELREYRVEVTSERLEEAIEQFTSSCRAAGVPFNVLKEERDEPFDFVISQSRYHDLTILGLREIFEFGLAGETEHDASLTLVRLLTSGARPIIAVPKTYRPVKRVLAAYSGSAESASTLRRFLQLRPFADIELRIVTFGLPRDRSDHLLENAAKYCRAQGVTPETQYLETSPQDHLLEEATRWNADLIVLGNSSKSLILRRVMGETALTAIRHADRPLFLSQ